MSNIPAFPAADCGHGAPYGGMDLRDYFAAVALSGISSTEGGFQANYSDVANWAYKYADAMLKAREARG